MTALRWSQVDGARAVAAEAWNALVDENDPFTEHGFLAALEESASVGRAAGAVPRFVLAWRGTDLVGAIPLYVKNHSYGEFIFDWSWAGAAQRAGIRYYPKLVAAAPFTPATGNRLLLRRDERLADVGPVLLAGAQAVADDVGASSIHFLFCQPTESEWLAQERYLARLSFQFHWHNRPGQPFTSFDDFLSTFRAENRKQVRKERRIAADHGLHLATKSGTDLNDEEWAALHRFYLANADKHGASAYLRPAFFAILRRTLAPRVVATFAYRGTTPVAGTLNFERGRHLYGRYWGCDEEHAMLHFELCYYRLIDRAIERGYTRFEAGAQGEHKLKRGLIPNYTHSAHWLRHPGLSAAVEAFLPQEAAAVRDEVAAYTAHSPLRREDPTP